TINLRQSIDCFCYQVVSIMFHPIPFFPQRNILDSKVSREINDPHIRSQQGGCLMHRHPIKARKENDITLFEISLCRITELQINQSAQAWKKDIDPLPTFLTRSNDLERHLRVPYQYA